MDNKQSFNLLIRHTKKILDCRIAQFERIFYCVYTILQKPEAISSTLRIKMGFQWGPAVRVVIDLNLLGCLQAPFSHSHH